MQSHFKRYPRKPSLCHSPNKKLQVQGNISHLGPPKIFTKAKGSALFPYGLALVIYNLLFDKYNFLMIADELQRGLGRTFYLGRLAMKI
jgi:hypothetical protein